MTPRSRATSTEIFSWNETEVALAPTSTASAISGVGTTAAPTRGSMAGLVPGVLGTASMAAPARTPRPAAPTVAPAVTATVAQGTAAAARAATTATTEEDTATTA